MPGFDDRLTRELERAARPASPSGVFDRVDRRRARRARMRKAQAAVLAGVVLAGTGGVLVLERVFRESDGRPAGSPTIPPSPSASPAVPQEWDPARISGVSFPACNVSKVDGHFVGSDSDDAAFVFGRRGDVGGCPEPGEGLTFVGLGTTDGQISVVSGPIECLYGCRVFAAPDLDGDGTQELAIVTVQGGPSLSIELYRMSTDSGNLGWAPIGIAPPGDLEGGLRPGRVEFPLYGSVTHVERLRCVDDDGGRRVVATVATRGFEDPRVYRVHESVFEFRSGQLHVVSSRDYRIQEEQIPVEGLEMGRDLCGVPNSTSD
jgi:hypothetical protein